MNRPHGHLTLVSSEGRLIQVDVPPEGFLLSETSFFPVSLAALQWAPQGERRGIVQRELSRVRITKENQELQEQIEQTSVHDLIGGFAEEPEGSAREAGSPERKSLSSGRLLGRILGWSRDSNS